MTKWGWAAIMVLVLIAFVGWLPEIEERFDSVPTPTATIRPTQVPVNTGKTCTALEEKGQPRQLAGTEILPLGINLTLTRRAYGGGCYLEIDFSSGQPERWYDTVRIEDEYRTSTPARFLVGDQVVIVHINEDHTLEVGVEPR